MLCGAHFQNWREESEMEVSAEEFTAMFENYERSAFRMETHQVYTIPREQPTLQKFLAGEDMPEDFGATWHTMIRNNIAAGKTMQRVKFVKRPFTDYLRYLMSWGVPTNAAAGEDYRILDITDRAIGIPEQDFWIFDESAVVLLNFNPDGTLIDRQFADPADLDKYLHWRDVALPEAVPLGEYRT
jgi:hypothetical protein